MNDSIYANTRNERWYRKTGHYHAVQLAAAGFQWPEEMKNASATEVYDWTCSYRCNSKYVGGVSASYDVRLQKDDKLYRFSGSNRHGIDRIRGAWWFNDEVYRYLKSHTLGGLEQFRDNARRAFCVLEEWGDMYNFVTVQLDADLWAILGSSADAYNETTGNSIHNLYGLNVCQIYIPGAYKVNEEVMRIIDEKTIGIPIRRH